MYIIQQTVSSWTFSLVLLCGRTHRKELRQWRVNERLKRKEARSLSFSILVLYLAIIKASTARWLHGDSMWKNLPIELSFSCWNAVVKFSFIHIYTMCHWGLHIPDTPWPEIIHFTHKHLLRAALLCINAPQFWPKTMLRWWEQLFGGVSRQKCGGLGSNVCRATVLLWWVKPV